MSPILNVNVALFVIACKTRLGIIDLQCCNYCHLLSVSSSKFQLPMTISVHLFVRKCHKKSCHNDTKYRLTLNTIFSVAYERVSLIHPTEEPGNRMTWCGGYFSELIWHWNSFS